MAQGSGEQAPGAQALSRTGSQTASALRALFLDVHFSTPNRY
jgi:hypothetical protein